MKKLHPWTTFKAFCTFWLEVAHDLGRLRSNLLAAGLAYYCTLAIFPLLLLILVTGAAIVGSSARLLRLVQETLMQVMASSAASTISAVITDAVDEGLVVGGLSLLLLIWAASHGFRLASVALDAIWHSEHTHSTAVRMLRAAAIVGVVALFGGLAFLVSIGYSMALHWSSSHLAFTHLAPLQRLFNPFRSLLYRLSSLFLTFLFYTFAHKFLPTRRIPWRFALLAGALSGAMAEAAKLVFNYAWVRPAAYNEIYGPITGVVLLVLWFYYAAYCLLIGAAAGRRCELDYLARKQGQAQ